MGLSITDLIGGTLGKTVKDVVGAFKLDPEKKAEFQAAVDANASIVEQKQIDIEGKAQDAISAEIDAASKIILAEAGSQSWLPRNVRPLLLFMWGSLITFNYLVPMIARFWIKDLVALPLDPWIYKLTVVGFTGYATLRTVEKIKEKDS